MYEIAFLSVFLNDNVIRSALGVAGSFLMPDSYHVEQTIVIAVMAGVAAGGVQSLQSSLPACLIYINVLILPLACWIFTK